MGILGRINRVIKSNVNEVLDKMSDPAKEVDLLIIEMEGGLKEAKAEVISSTAAAKRLEMRVGEVQREVDRWQQRAEQAVRGGDDELAREALKRKVEHDRELETAQRNVAEQRGYVDELKASLKALEARLEDVKLRKGSIKQRARAAKDGEQPLAGSKAFSKFDELERRIEAQEEMQEITSSMEGREAATEAKFARLERQGNPEVEDELEELKRRMEEGK